MSKCLYMYVALMWAITTHKKALIKKAHQLISKNEENKSHNKSSMLLGMHSDIRIEKDI